MHPMSRSNTVSFQDDLLMHVKDECLKELSFTEKETRCVLLGLVIYISSHNYAHRFARQASWPPVVSIPRLSLTSPLPSRSP